MEYIGIVLLVVVMVVIAWVILGSGNKKEKGAPTEKKKENVYEDLRGLAFKTTHHQLGIELPFDVKTPYGIVMDWYIGNGVATLTCFSSGDTSLYFSGGAAILGGIGITGIRDMAKNYVSQAVEILPLTSKTEEFPLPEPQMVRFYILTNQGVYVGTESMAQFQTGQSKWFPLFISANNIMSEMRKADEARLAAK